MTAGFEVRRSDGKVAVSSVYPHYRFVKKIRGVDNFWDTSGQYYSPHVIVAFRPVNSTDLETYRFSIGSTNLWYFWGMPSPPPNATLSLFGTTECDAYIFDVAHGVAASSGAGLQVFNLEGVMTFDAAGRYMRMLDVIQGRAPTSSNPFSNPYPTKLLYPYPNEHKLAIIPLKEGFDLEYSSRGEEQMYGLTWFSVEGSSVGVRMVYMLEDYGGSSSGGTSHTQFNLLVIDVTNTELL